MSTPPVDAFDEAPAHVLTLDDRRQAFNQAYQNAHGRSRGMRSMGVSPLAPLFVPGAILLGDTADIGINRALVQPSTQGLLVEVQAYPDMQPGDVIEVFMHPQGWPNAPTPVKTATLGIGRAGSNIALYVPEQHVGEGMLDAYCRITRADRREVEESPRLSVWCKLSLPAGPDLRPDEPWHSELHAPQVLSRIDAQTLGEFVHATVEPYPGMTPGDRVRLHWGLQQVEYQVQAQDIGQAMTVHIPADVLRQAGDSDALALYYRVIDPLNNVSEKGSARAFVQVRLGDALLEAPCVYAADAPQVLDASCLGYEDVPLLVWADTSAIQPGDELEITGFGNGALGQLIEIRPERQTVTEPGKIYTFMLANAQVQRLARGLLIVHYKIHRANACVGQSLHRYIDVLGRAPELPMPVVEDACDGVLQTTGNSCTVTISYPGMAMGDWLELFFHGLTSAGYAYAWQLGRSVSRNGAVRQQLTFTFGADQIAALDGGSVQLRYQVWNESLPSPLESRRVWVHVGALHAELAPPVVPAAGGDGRLTQASIGAGVQVMVPTDPSIKPGSTVRVQWLGDTAASSSEGVAQALVYTTPRTVAEASVGHSVQLTYVVHNVDDGRARQSLPCTLWIIADEPVVLREPVALDANSALLDPTLLPAGARFQAAYQGMLAGDEVVLMLTGKQAYSSPALRVAPLQPWVFNVPNEVLQANAGDLIQVSYSVRREGRPVLFSPRLNLQVLDALGITVAPLELKGLSIKVADWTGTGLASVGNTATRVASGGVAPYTYVSNSPAVASVTATGLVTGNRNGNAEISVTDQRGEQVKYTVKVSNVYQLLYHWGPLNHNQAVAWMASIGGQPCNARAVADLKRVYGPKLPTGDYWHFWLCEKNGCGGSGLAFYHATHQAVYCADYFNTNIHAAWCIRPV